jgi:hypothetical protein
MNDLGSLALDIVTYSIQETGRFPVSFVSGWLDVNIGQLNWLTHEDFVINSTGAFEPSLEPVEKSIYTLLFEKYYYDKASREALRGIVWDNSLAEAIIMVKEGDSTIQRTSKHQVSKTFAELAKETQSTLDSLLFQYNRTKAAPQQVVGDNDQFYPTPYDNKYY